MNDNVDPKAEIDAGKDLPGIPGCMFRLLDQADVRNVEKWLNGERTRGTPQVTVFDVVAAAIASMALQVAGRVNRHQVRSAARDIMTSAAHMLESDIVTLLEAKKGHALRMNNMRIITEGETKDAP